METNRYNKKMKIRFNFWFNTKSKYGEGNVYVFSTPGIAFYKDNSYWMINIHFLFWELTIENE